MTSAGEMISKDLAVIKGQLAATRTRLQWIMRSYGDELLQHDSGQELPEVQMGIHLTTLLLKLEIYREHVDKFTSSVRKKYGMPELKIRKDTTQLRDQFMEQMKELQEEMKDLSPEGAKKFLDKKIAEPMNRKGFLSQK